MGKIKNCEWCGKEFEDKHRDGKRFCSRSCSCSYKNKTYGNPQTGKVGRLNPNWKGGTVKTCKGCGKVFDDDKRLGKQYCTRSCAAKHKRNKERERNPKTKICKTCGNRFETRRLDAKYCSRKCYHNSSNFLELQGKRNKGKPVPEHAKQAVSKANSRRNAESVFTSGNNGHYNSKKAGNVFYRSSYELIGYKLLDDDKSVLSFRPEPLVIEYINQEGNIRRYRPDILINWSNGSASLVEIKPKWQLSDAKVKLKLKAGRDFAKQKGWKFEVWTEKELGIK